MGPAPLRRRTGPTPDHPDYRPGIIHLAPDPHLDPGDDHDVGDDADDNTDRFADTG